ncbi:CAF17-like 4Fe-4S cluster assembly/insertion protein YgfZ, partial [Klebsiella pneumoniae]|uniref:CAF17-like 4Fe-4S cluster assembly/insertion protein YgfZ n=1 Tax=Klebsiella pneumoniae TaxID=573 RepID=UPI00272F84DC
IAWVRGATVEAFVPQMINFEVLGGVSFKKGCYPGQEVVARSQYRGTLKRRLQLFETDSTAAIGQEIFHSADPEQPAGVVAGA